MEDQHYNEPVGECKKCGKMCFPTRKAARHYKKKRFPQASMTIYKCGEYFHFGHTPYGIKRGITDRRSYSLDRRKP